MLWKKALLLLLLLFCTGAAGSAIAQTGTITGTVTDASSGETLPGANIVIVGADKGASTNVDGEFTVTGITPGTYQVRASFVGYRPATMSDVTVTDGETTEVSFSLKPGVQMDEMVVVGYGTQEKNDVTGSISSVPTQDLEESAIESAQEAIQGKVAGVTVTQNSGSPGSGFSIRIRGTGTTGNSNPLYVVDGTPVTGATQAGVGGIDFLNPSDIESIDILKGASAAAIYGSQAANGAVIITTKSGTAGERTVSFNAYTGTQSTPRTLDMVSGPEFAVLRNEADINAGQSPTFSSPSQYLGPGGTTDYQDEVFRRGVLQNYNLAVSGGTEDLTYRISGGYYSEGGIIEESSLDRLNVRVNTEFDVSPILTVGEKVTFKRSTRNTILENDAVRNTLIQTLQVDPTVPARDSDGNFTAQPRTNAQNPLAVLDFRNNENVDTRLVGNVFADVSPLESLSARSQFGFDLRYGNTYAFTPTYDISQSFQNDNASATQYSDVERSLVWDNTVTFDKVFSDVHDVRVLGGTTVEINDYRFINGTTQGQPGNDSSLRYIGSGTEVVNLEGTLTESNLLSFFGRVNYNYDSRYLLTAVARYDGSSKFGENNRFAFFPSFSAAWRISEEPFFPDTDLVNNLKLRAGWGQNGNQRIGDYTFASTIADAQDYVLNGQLAPGSAPLQSANPNVKWEETTQTDIGLEATLLSERLDVNVGFFNKRTDDLLVYLPPIPTSGLVNFSPENAGEIRNRGWEFSANYQAEPFEDFSFNIGGNLTTLDNEVLSLSNSDYVIDNGFYRGKSLTRTAPGHPVGAFYGYVTDGLFQTEQEVQDANALNNDPDTPYQEDGTAPGDIRFKDLNGDGEITEEDQTFIGSPQPDFTYGINLRAEYKGLSLSTFFQGSYGNDIYAAYKEYTVFNSAFNMSEEAKERWTGPGTSTRVPRLTSSDPNQNARESDFFVEDGSYLRLKNIQLAYEVPQRFLGALSATGLTKARAYVSAKNLVTITGYDGYTPEIGVNGDSDSSTLDRGIDRATYPQPRSYTVGIGLTF